MPDSKDHQNYIAVYLDNAIRGWIENRNEIDKQLLTLSALAIGLLIGALGSTETRLEFCIWIGAGTAYFLCILMVFWVFRKKNEYMRNGMDLLTAVINDKKKEAVGFQKLESEMYWVLGNRTSVAFLLFLVGAVLTIWLAILQALQ